MKQDYLDVIVVGAGISGIGAGAHLNTKCRTKLTQYLKEEKILAALGICLSILELGPIQICIL